MSGSEGQKMWGGRFERPPEAGFYEFERSWQFDRRLLPQELALDRAWAHALAAAGILTQEECQQITDALERIKSRAESDSVWLDSSKAEDVHHFVEAALIEKLGQLGAKLHTGRSRNEMVATEFRMYVKDAAREMRCAVAALMRAIANQAKANLPVPLPGTTHMQHAQPLLVSTRPRSARSPARFLWHHRQQSGCRWRSRLRIGNALRACHAGHASFAL